MSLEGLRVVRGPDWSYGNKDGGEGHVGTVKKDNEDDTVEVQWDMGESHTCRTGKDGKCDLRVLDSGPSGLKHTWVTCDECKQENFPGTRWKCVTCENYDLCTPCYFNDKHMIQHPFKRIDLPGLSGATVPKRSISNKMRSLGIFKGASVRRGPDWEDGDKDGGNGKVGTVESTENYRFDGRERNAVKVAWPNKEGNMYKLGYRGKVDLICVEETPGMDYYRDHLFVLSTTNVPKRRTFIRQSSSLTSLPPQPQMRVQAPPTPSTDTNPRFKPGDRVCVQLMEIALKDVQRGHGGWSMKMADIIGQHGTVKNVEESGDVTVQYDDRTWRFNATALRKVPTLKVGETVRVLDDADKVQALQKKHGDWSSDMVEVLGKVGRIVKIDSDGDVAVVFGNKAVVFNPACCIPAPGNKPDQLFEDTSKGSNDAFKDAGATGGAGARSASNRQGQNEERVTDQAAIAQLMAQLFVLRGQASSVGPQELLVAASEGNLGQVRQILSSNSDLVNRKSQGLTSLIIASHEGHLEVVKFLVDSRADLNLTDEHGNTALMAALMKRRETVALHLIEKGANIHLLNIHNRNALHAAALNGANTALKVLIEKGCNPNQVDVQGNTPIHDAILSKNNSCVAFLCGAPNINLKICNGRGLSPLHLAAMNDDELSASKILARQPDLISKSRTDGHTPLHVAALNGNMDVAKLLIKLKAPIDMRNVQDLTPLHMACLHARLKMTQLLLDHSASVSTTDNEGNTPLHICMVGERVPGGDPFLALMMGVHIRDQDELRERLEVACLLIKNGANVNATNRRGMTPLQCCSNESLCNAVRQFIQKHYGSQRAGQTKVGNLLGEFFAAVLSVCRVCDQGNAEVTFLPCGHKVCCESCCFKIRQCPLCGQMIGERIGADGNRLVLLEDPCRVQ